MIRPILFSRHRHSHEVRFVAQPRGLGRIAVNELCAELNGYACVRVVECDYATANTVARFENEHALACALELARRHQSRGARSNDYRVN